MGRHSVRAGAAPGVDEDLENRNAEQRAPPLPADESEVVSSEQALSAAWRPTRIHVPPGVARGPRCRGGADQRDMHVNLATVALESVQWAWRGHRSARPSGWSGAIRVWEAMPPIDLAGTRLVRPALRGRRRRRR